MSDSSQVSKTDFDNYLDSVFDGQTTTRNTSSGTKDSKESDVDQYVKSRKRGVKEAEVQQERTGISGDTKYLMVLLIVAALVRYGVGLSPFSG